MSSNPARRFAASFTALAVLSFALPSSVSAATTLTFDDVTSLAQYAPLGVTFSPNASLWTSDWPSVLITPDGGTYTPPNGLQFGIAGGEQGSIYLSTPMSYVSIWALSGPSGDLLNAPMWIRAFDSNNQQIGEDNIDPSLQFDFLSISAPGIVRIDTFSPIVNHDAWDQFTFEVPEPATVTLAAGVALLLAARKRRPA